MLLLSTMVNFVIILIYVNVIVDI